MVHIDAPTQNHDYLIWEDELPSPAAQSRTLLYLHAVLEWQLRAEGWATFIDLACFHPAIENGAQMIVPDLLVFKGIDLSPEQRRTLRSWDLRAGLPCPPVAIEVSSEGTWRTDVGSKRADKPMLYGQIGVREYLAYDPNVPAYWGTRRRVRLWRYDAAGRGVEQEADERGWLWSVELASWVGSEGADLRLYDADGRLRLTEAQAQEEARYQAEAREVAERAARLEAEAARQRAEAQEVAERAARLAAEAELATLRRLLNERS